MPNICDALETLSHSGESPTDVLVIDELRVVCSMRDHTLDRIHMSNGVGLVLQSFEKTEALIHFLIEPLLNKLLDGVRITLSAAINRSGRRSPKQFPCIRP